LLLQSCDGHEESSFLKFSLCRNVEDVSKVSPDFFSLSNLSDSNGLLNIDVLINGDSFDLLAKKDESPDGLLSWIDPSCPYEFMDEERLLESNLDEVVVLDSGTEDLFGVLFELYKLRLELCPVNDAELNLGNAEVGSDGLSSFVVNADKLSRGRVEVPRLY
jgi:hypothetical protein